MGSTRNYQLLGVGNDGRTRNITNDPNSKDDLFETFQQAEKFALANRELFPNGRFVCLSVYILPEVEQEEKGEGEEPKKE